MKLNASQTNNDAGMVRLITDKKTAKNFIQKIFPNIVYVSFFR